MTPVAKYYPRPTSSVIMTMKPPINPRVEISVKSPCCASGTTSSTTTNIIAPAAKHSAYGNIGSNVITAQAPSTAAKGSTIAESCP